jgi:hypothetical protein
MRERFMLYRYMAVSTVLRLGNRNIRTGPEVPVSTATNFGLVLMLRDVDEGEDKRGGGGGKGPVRDQGPHGSSMVSNTQCLFFFI